MITKREIRIRLACAAIIGSASKETVDEWFNWIMEASNESERSADKHEDIDDLIEQFDKEREMEENLVKEIQDYAHLKFIKASRIMNILRNKPLTVTKTDALLITRLFTRSNLSNELSEAIQTGKVEGSLPECRDVEVTIWHSNNSRSKQIQRRPVGSVTISTKSLLKWIDSDVSSVCLVKNKVVRDMIDECR